MNAILRTASTWAAFLLAGFIESVAGCGSITGPSTVPSSLFGTYTLELNASATCNMVTDGVTSMRAPLPSVAKSRTYEAVIALRAGRPTIVFTPAECQGESYNLPGQCGPLPSSNDCHQITFPNGGCADVSMTGAEFTFSVPPATRLCGGGDYWWEEFSVSEVFEACGTWRATVANVNADVIEGTVAGTFGYSRRAEPGSPSLWASNLYCQATDHRFVLTRHP